ncbi:hypothetical protein [Hymenobacter armeniacus]|uniref:Uncharacterized protein n=1 Tax=Hymenobacter armeniacus TaxID=2771358 RepID=A0ABR8JN45_9BACT|nr:hypothetical protein [Hymenobacter armeniacus]MBD2721410.1 hypothetical protein [Hymenobacter armeniacus]
MKTIPVKVWNRIDMLQKPIAAIARASASNQKRWVMIDVKRWSVVAQPPHLYHVSDIEFDMALLNKYAEDGDEDLAIVAQTSYYVADVAELYALLLQLEVGPESFNAPWHVGYPL